jgi:serine protease AprX
LGAVLAGIAATVLLAQPAAATAIRSEPGDPGPQVGVIVGYETADEAERAVRRAGGTVGARLELVDSFAATVPANRLDAVRESPGVAAVTPDGRVTMTGKTWLADAGNTSISNVTRMIGAQDVWSKKDASGRAVTGKGVGVAVIDSGIVPAKGLADGTRIVNGPDLSLEAPQATGPGRSGSEPVRLM